MKIIANFLKLSREEAIGKPVNEVIENTRMHEVIETGHRAYRFPSLY